MWQFSALLFLFLSGCSTAEDSITGPEEVSGREQGSLTVQCRYTSNQDYSKYWCRGADWRSCKILVETDSSEQLVKKNRVSIWDNQTNFTITVTMENLRSSDADIYWCGITKFGKDPIFKVKVNIDTASESSTKIRTTTCTVLTTSASTIENTGNDQVTQGSPRTRSLLGSISFQLLVFLKLPLLLGMLSVVLWMSRPQRCFRGGDVGQEKTHSSDTQD